MSLWKIKYILTRWSNFAYLKVVFKIIQFSSSSYCILKAFLSPPNAYKKQSHDFANKGQSSQSYGFSSSHVWMWELEYKEAECWRTDAFERWWWRWLLRVPWTSRRPNQSILKAISPEYSWEGLTLKLELKYFGHLMWKTDPFGKTLMLGKIQGKGRWQRMRWLDGITD